jgi:hypothetical protein
LWIDACGQKNVKESFAVQNFEAIINALSNSPWAIIWTCQGESAFNAENNFLAVLGIGCKVVVQELKGVGRWRTIELGAIPEVRAAIQGCLYGFGSFIV